MAYSKLLFVPMGERKAQVIALREKGPIKANHTSEMTKCHAHIQVNLKARDDEG